MTVKFYWKGTGCKCWLGKICNQHPILTKEEVYAKKKNFTMHNKVVIS